MMMQIVIRLPPNYPLQGVKVEGINRVAASERKWTGWLMNTQGAMTFDVSYSPALRRNSFYVVISTFLIIINGIRMAQ